MRVQRYNNEAERNSRKAFTLIELLVVIAVIALLMSIMLPALRKAKESARSVVCRTRLKQLGLAIQLYAQDNDDEIVTQDWHNPRIREDYWYVRISKYLDNVGSDSKLGQFMRCPAGQAVKDYGKEFSFSWTAVDYALKSWPKETETTGSSIVYIPHRLSELRQPASFATVFDFFYGSKETGPLAGGTVFRSKWDGMVNNPDKPEYREAIFRHTNRINIVFADASVVSIKAEIDQADGYRLETPDWERDMHQE